MRHPALPLAQSVSPTPDHPRSITHLTNRPSSTPHRTHPRYRFPPPTLLSSAAGIPSPFFSDCCRPHLLLSLARHLMPVRARRRRSPYPRPPPPPRLSELSTSSASSASSSSTILPASDALLHRHHRRFRRRPPKLIAVDSGATGRPRPRPRARWTRCEHLHLTPLTPLPLARRSRRPLAARSTPPAELAVNAAPVTIWSPRRLQHARSTP